MSGTTILTDSQIAEFRRDGFTVVRGLYSSIDMAKIRDWTETLSQAPEVVGKEWKFFEKSQFDGSRLLCRIENFVPHHDGFQRLVQRRRMLHAVSELFGEPALLFKDKLNFKLPGGDGFAAHQDVQAGWDAYAPLHITAMVAIDATTAANGSLEVAAGLHDKGLLGEMWAPLTDEAVNPDLYEPLHCESGDALFFSSYAPHRSAPNRSGVSRRVLYVTYNAASAGDHRARYYADKHKNLPPDIERDPNHRYAYKV